MNYGRVLWSEFNGSPYHHNVVKCWSIYMNIEIILLGNLKF